MMPVFWLLVVGMLTVALVIVLRPLYSRSVTRNVDATAAQVSIYRNRLQEMEVEIANGVLSVADAENARTELARALLQQTDTVSGSVADTSTNTSYYRRLAGVIVVLVPAIAVPLYLHLGTPGLVNESATVHDGRLGDAAHVESVAAMVQRLADRLEQNPDDAKGWMMLVNSYITLGRYDQALKAVERLYLITGDQPDVLVRYADVLATVNNGDLSGKPALLIQKALILEPDNVVGLWLAGMAASQTGDPATAIAYWQRLLPLLDTDEAARQEVNDLIVQARGKMGGKVETLAPAAITDANAQVVANDALTIQVTLAADFSKNVKPEHTLFIVAKAVNGPPMPVAVIRKTVADLPLDITMNDSHAMMPSMKLSSFPLLEVSARISPGGNALPVSGDPISATIVVSPGQNDPVALIINRKAP